ncbi:Flp pilus assembly protein CpaB [Chengkuizengella marina]|uniref:Flp pilus assembly protein CpaB n=1 Tax=Chengkuizengella marina TaxID=2507566 RepID=A0A6N9Q220_9BACL|nr:Flp pilus assembly protein CpaB [Chengkuizengella marina]NBI28364.1 Flp pilus assembly protein CpaB [Chengkuizengella marina]
MRSKITLILAVVMGLVTTLLFYKYINDMDTSAEENVKFVQVVASKQLIPENQVITDDLIELIKVPEGGAHPQAIRNTQEVVGKIALADFVSGQIILPHHIGSEAEESLFISRKIKEGFRAVSIGVNFVTSVSNLIEPEDIVDVIWTQENLEAVNTPETGEHIDNVEVTSDLLLKEVRVLAVGRRMIESTTDTEYVEYISSTLELSPEDALKLVNAANSGEIQLILHSRIDEEDVNKDEK